MAETERALMLSDEERDDLVAICDEYFRTFNAYRSVSPEISRRVNVCSKIAGASR